MAEAKNMPRGPIAKNGISYEISNSLSSSKRITITMNSVMMEPTKEMTTNLNSKIAVSTDLNP